MVLTIEPFHMPIFERSVQGKDEEISVRPSLNANAVHHLAFGGAGLVF
jgi:hypothetical protein